jgi:hypothetical protein
MILSEAGEARVRGYLYVFERSMRAAQPPDIVSDAVREVESHIRERVAETDPLPDERSALERVLDALGTPTRVARAYSIELHVDEALASGRFLSTLRAVGLLASTTVAGFVAALFLLTGYVGGFGFLAVGVLTALLPTHFGLEIGDGFSFGPFSEAPGREQLSGPGVVVLCGALGLALLVLTHKGARAWMRWVRAAIDRNRERNALAGIRATAGIVAGAVRAVSLDSSIEEALHTPRLVATLRAVWLLATITVAGFVGAIVIFTGYVSGASFIVAAGAQLFLDQSVVMMFGEPQRGWWVAPACILLGLGLLFVTHKGARAWIGWIRTRISSKEHL